MEYGDIHIAPSLIEPMTFYLFRENGIEVKFKITNCKVYSQRRFRPSELRYIEENILKMNDSISSIELQ